MRDTILLIDGLNFVWRANVKFGWGDKEQTSPSYTIVYNFFRNLRAIIEDFQPTKVFFCLEGSNCFRYALFPDYKGNRITKTADDKAIKKASDKEYLNRQRDIIIDLLPNLPITIVNADGFECDDVIATLVENLQDEDVVVYSSDKDFIQLLQKGYINFRLYSPNKKGFVEPPSYSFLSYLCLTGDKADNIPSIVGPKKAEKLAADVMAFAEFLDSSEENRSNYALNLSLIKLHIIADEQLRFVPYNTNYAFLKEQFEKMEMPTMIAGDYWDRFVKTFEGLR